MVDQFQGNLADIDISLKQSRDELDEFRKQLKLPIPDRRSHQEVVVELVSEIEQKQTLISQLERKSSNLSRLYDREDWNVVFATIVVA